MVFKKTTVGLRAIVAAAAMSGALSLFAGDAQAAKIGPLFPIPNGFSINGIARDSLLAIEAMWLQDGVDNINKARKETEAALEKAARDIQSERKNKLLLNVNQWINELNHLATEQMKIAIMKDGAEAATAQARNYQLSEQADNLEKAKHDPSLENWGK